MVLLRAVFDRVGPTVPSPLVPALVPYFVLFEELLLRGSDDRLADAHRLAHEVAKPGMPAYVRERVLGWQFGRIVATVARLGPEVPPVTVAKVIWPPMQSEQIVTVTELVRDVQRGLAETARDPRAAWFRQELLGRGWGVPGVLAPKRGRGRPRHQATEGLVAMGVVDEMFAGGAKPYADVAATIADISDGRITQKSTYKRMKTARREPPQPEDWGQSLWCERIAPLHVDYFKGGAASRAAALTRGPAKNR